MPSFKLLDFQKKGCLFLFLFFIAQSVSAQKMETFAKEFIPLWERATTYTVEVAEAMPESAYDFKPTDDVFTFRQQIIHLIQNLYWLNSTYIKQEVNPSSSDDLSGLSKEDLIKLLKEAFKYVGETAKNVSDKETKRTVKFADVVIDKERIFYLMRDHMTHHRAECIVYLRLNNINPPRYRGW